MWLCTIRYISKCEIDVRYYPLDEQKCDLKFGSWSQEATKVAHNILLDFKDFFVPLSSSLLPHPAQLAPGRKHQQEENPQLVHNQQRIWASRLWRWFLINDQIVRKLNIFSGRREESSDPCCEDKFANVIYTIRLWRWPTRNILNSWHIFANVWDEIRWNSYWVPLPDDQPFIWSTTFFPLSWSMSVF